MTTETLSINKRKRLAQLDKRKYRLEYGLFAVEGTKAFQEILNTNHYHLQTVVATRQWLEHHELPEIAGCEILVATSKDMTMLSSLVNAPDIIGFFNLSDENNQISVEGLKGKLSVVLDGVQDPGNLGTIIRLCDWWGVENLICSSSTADCYAPKVVQATMGALGRVNVLRTDSLEKLLGECKSCGLPLFGTFMNGEDVFRSELPDRGLLLMGSEGKGISEALIPMVDRRLTIPPYPSDNSHVESLNVATATAILLGQFRYGSRH